MTLPNVVFYDSSNKAAGLPELGGEQACERKDCPGPESNLWLDHGYGLTGGGCGVYSVCKICNQVRGKSVDQ